MWEARVGAALLLSLISSVQGQSQNVITIAIPYCSTYASSLASYSTVLPGYSSGIYSSMSQRPSSASSASSYVPTPTPGSYDIQANTALNGCNVVSSSGPSADSLDACLELCTITPQCQAATYFAINCMLYATVRGTMPLLNGTSVINRQRFSGYTNDSTCPSWSSSTSSTSRQVTISSSVSTSAFSVSTSSASSLSVPGLPSSSGISSSLSSLSASAPSSSSSSISSISSVTLSPVPSPSSVSASSSSSLGVSASSLSSLSSSSISSSAVSPSPSSSGALISSLSSTTTSSQGFTTSSSSLPTDINLAARIVVVVVSAPPSSTAASSTSSSSSSEVVAPSYVPPSSSSSSASSSSSTEVGPVPTPTQSFGKRGLAYTNGSYTLPFSLSGQNSLVSWGYNWFYNRFTAGSNATNPVIQFIPMIFSDTENLQRDWPAGAQAAIDDGATALMSFNEPDVCYDGSACMLNVTQTVEAHKRAMEPFYGRPGLQIGAPAISDNRAEGHGPSYLSWFMGNCTGCQIDYVNIHYYNNVYAFGYLQSYIFMIWEMFGLPIWITEIGIDGSTPTELQKQAYLQQIIPWLDAVPFVDRYVWFYDAPGYLIEEDGEGLSAQGMIYNAYVASCPDWENTGGHCTSTAGAPDSEYLPYTFTRTYTPTTASPTAPPTAAATTTAPPYSYHGQTFLQTSSVQVTNAIASSSLSSSAVATPTPSLLYLLQEPRGNYISHTPSTGQILLTTAASLATPFYTDSSGISRANDNPILVFADFYSPSTTTPSDYVALMAPQTNRGTWYSIACSGTVQNLGDVWRGCRASGSPAGNPVVRGFGLCPGDERLYMIPASGSASVPCNNGEGYALDGFTAVSYPASSSSSSIASPSTTTAVLTRSSEPPTTTTTTTTTTTSTASSSSSSSSAPPTLTPFVLADSNYRTYYITFALSGANAGRIEFTTDINQARLFTSSGTANPVSYDDPSLVWYDSYDASLAPAKDYLVLSSAGPSSNRFPVTCGNFVRNVGDWWGSCQSSGSPAGNPVVYGMGICPNVQPNLLYMIPNSSNVRCSGGYAFAGFYAVAAPATTATVTPVPQTEI